MAEPLNHLKKDYRARFCHGAGKQQINIQPGQNAWKIIHDCFENCASDSTITSPSITHCSTPVILNQKEDNLFLNKKLQSGLSSVKKTFNYTSSVASPVKSISRTAGEAPEARQKSEAPDDVVSSNKEGHEFKEDKRFSEDLFDAGDPPGSNKKAYSIAKDVERSNQSSSGISDDEDNYEIIGSPVLVEEAETSVHLSNLDEQATPAMMKRPMEAQRLEGPQARTEDQTDPVERTKCDTVPSEQERESLSSAFLVAVTTGANEKRYSASIALPPSPVKDLDLGMENECEFLIDESDSFSSATWFSIPRRNQKIEKQALAKSVPKSQPSERKKAVVQESMKFKDRNAQNEVAVKMTRSTMEPCHVAEEIQDELENASDTNLGLSAKKEDTVESIRRSSPHVEESKKHTQGQKFTRTPNKKKSTKKREKVLKQIPRKFTLPLYNSDEDTSDAEYKPTELPNEDSFGSDSIDEQPEDEVASSKEDHNFPKSSQSILKTAVCSFPKKQTAKKKLSEVTSAKKLAENQRNEVKKSALLPMEEDERELLKSNEVVATSLQQQSQTSALQKSLKSPKPKNIICSIESSGNIKTKTPTKSKEPSQNCTDVGDWKRASAKSTHSNQRANMIVCSSPESVEFGDTTDHINSSGPVMEEQKHKKSNASVKTKYIKKNNVHQSQDSSAPEENKNHSSGPILKRSIKFTSKNDKPIEHEWEDSSSDTSVDLNSESRDFLSKTPLKHKLVMPTQTPNLRRTKRIRLKPLEYWRGERVNYVTRPSGGFVVGGILSPEADPCGKARNKRERAPKTRNHLVEQLNVSLADTSKPTAVWDPIINGEILLECVNTGNSKSSFYQDESVEIYKNLNTPVFAAGKLILKPLKQKGLQFVHTDQIVFHVIRGKIMVTLHKTSYFLTTGDFFYVPEGNEYNIHNLLNEEGILLFTQLKGESKHESSSSILQFYEAFSDYQPAVYECTEAYMPKIKGTDREEAIEWAKANCRRFIK